MRRGRTGGGSGDSSRSGFPSSSPVESPAASATVVTAFLAHAIWPIGGLRGPLLIAALIPLIQAPEGMASATLLVRNRYDVRGAFLAWSMALRLVRSRSARRWAPSDVRRDRDRAGAWRRSPCRRLALNVFRRWPQAQRSRSARIVRRPGVRAPVDDRVRARLDARPPADRARRDRCEQVADRQLPRRSGAADRSRLAVVAGAARPARRTDARCRARPRRPCVPPLAPLHRYDRRSSPVRRSCRCSGSRRPGSFARSTALGTHSAANAVARDAARSRRAVRLRLDEVVSGLDRPPALADRGTAARADGTRARSSSCSPTRTARRGRGRDPWLVARPGGLLVDQPRAPAFAGDDGRGDGVA